jgi:hypothetical protein
MLPPPQHLAELIQDRDLYTPECYPRRFSSTEKRNLAPLQPFFPSRKMSTEMIKYIIWSSSFRDSIFETSWFNVTSHKK